MNVFIVSLFSYIGLFFVLPHELWLVVKGLVASFFPFRGRAYSYESLVCSQQIFSVKPALKDVWAFNVSLLAVRSPLFVSPPRNSAQLVRPDLTDCMFIHVHRDAAAYDFWRFHQLPDGRLVSPSPPTSSRVYKIIVEGFFLEDAVRKVGSKISIFLAKNDPSCPPPLPPVALLATVADNLASVSFARPGLLSHQMALVNNALASERRMRHQNKLRVDQVARCFYCGLGEDSITHIYAHCPVIIEARGVFFGSKDLPLSSLSLTSFAESRGSEGKRLEAPSVDRADSCCSAGSSLSSVCVVCPSHCVGVHPHTLTETPTPRVSDSITHTYTPTLSLSSDSLVRSSFLHTHTPSPSYTPTHMQTHTDTHISTHVQTNTHTSLRTQPNTQPNTHPSTLLGAFHSCSISPSLESEERESVGVHV